MRPFRSLYPQALALAAASALLAGAARADQPLNVDKVNKKIDNVTLQDAAGKPVSLYGLKDKKAVVVLFLSFDCPVSNSYAPLLAELAGAYAGRQVAFLAINSSDDGDAAQIAKRAAEFKLPFPVLKDDNHVAADAFKAEIVPAAFVLDHNFVLRYRGRIDNAYAARLRKNAQTTQHDLRQALDELLAGKDVTEPATRVVGCPIPRGQAARKTGTVTYYRDVLPILQANCQQCHRPGEVGPFALMTYKQAVNWASDIKEYTRERKMPPWKPVEGPAFVDERKLSEKEIATLAAWADGGTPEGDPKDAPPPRPFVEGWQLGKPDLVLTVPEEMTVAGGGKDLFRVFVLPTGLTEDKYVTAVEIRPGNKRAVHHSLNFFDRTGQGRELEKKEKERAAGKGLPDHGPGYSVAMGVGFRPTNPGDFGGLGGWAPGLRSRHLPAGGAYFLPKGSDVLLQVHYHRTGRVEKDRTALGLYFAKTATTVPWKGMVIAGRFLYVPAGDEHYRVRGAIEIDQDCQLYSVMPHMHMLGRQIKVTLTPPAGKPQALVAIKDWDYNWQETYFLKEAIPVRAGTKIAVEAFYDNSAKNPNNPFNPPRRVWFGDETTDEMCFVFLGATSQTPGRIMFRQEGAQPVAPKKPTAPAR
jgi:thiol-disulfide isomerase/thioredoxin